MSSQAPTQQVARSLRPAQSMTTTDLKTWEAQVASVLSSGTYISPNQNRVTTRKHVLVVERQDPIYKMVASLEGIMIILSSFSFVALSLGTVFFAFSMLSNFTG